MTYRIAVVAGDGVGKEVVPAALDVVRSAAERGGFGLELEDFPWGCEHYHRHGSMLAPDALDVLRGFDAIFLGAIGDPSVPDHVSSWGAQLRIRQEFDLYVNLRPIELLPGVVSPLRAFDGGGIDFVCVRENSEGEYAGAGGRVHRGFPGETAVQTQVFTRAGIDRVARYAFALARTRRGRLTSVTKSNALAHSFVLWDEVVADVARDFPDVEIERVHGDAAAAYLVTRPQSFDVVLASNLFGDVLTDLGAAIQGSIGLAASANVNPDGGFAGMFEPAHGSAPDIAGRNRANPVGAVWSAALMLDHLGERDAAAAVMAAVRHVLQAGPRTADLGGTASTREVADAIAAAVASPAVAA